MSVYKYRPVRFYVTVFAGTWLPWIAAAILGQTGGADESVVVALMIFGLFVPSVTAIVTVLASKSSVLKRDLRNKLIGLFNVKPLVILASVVLFFSIIVVSIFISTLFGGSWEQFALTDFSFAIGGIPTLFTIILVAFVEELGWRGYAEDAIASYMSWWRESWLFGVVWSLWHLPLFFIPGTYQNNILLESPWFMVNFFVSIMPLCFLFTWVYVKNNRSIFACMFFHFTVNFLQEQIGMTQETKCIQTFVLIVAAVVIVLLNKDLFFSTRHVGNLLGERRE